MGTHGYDIFKADNGLWTLEPQTAEFFPFRTEGYLPEYVLI